LLDGYAEDDRALVRPASSLADCVWLPVDVRATAGRASSSVLGPAWAAVPRLFPSSVFAGLAAG
jgi:hypothetical protein